MKFKAFTLLELLIVFALMGILFALFLLYSQVTQVRTDLYGQVDTFVSYARLVQSDAATGKDGQGHGIHLEANSYTLFSGEGYDILDSSNELIELPPTVEIQNISLFNGGNELIFTPPMGETLNYGSLDFVSLANNQAITITFYANGNLDY